MADARTEKIKLTAVTINAIALGLVAVGVIQPLLSDRATPTSFVSAALFIGAFFILHCLARKELDRLGEGQRWRT